MGCGQFQILQSKLNWHLNERSLAFIEELYQKNNPICDELMDEILKLCEQNTLYLQSDHMDTVIASLLKQRELPVRALSFLSHFLDRRNPAVEASIQSLRTQHGPELAATAKKYNLIHHDIPHALEIKKRTMHVVCEELNLVSTDNKTDRFLRSVAGFLVEFHDYVQVDKGHFKSVELASAFHLIEWLTTTLGLGEELELRKIIEFMADQIIVLGTTMVFSHQQTTDLSQLFLMIEDAAVRAGCFVAHESNLDFIRFLKTVMLVTGICDKSPAAVCSVATMQHSDAKTATLTVIKSYYQRPLILERFFASPLFISPSVCEPPSSTLDQQRFFITLVPNLCMSAELNKGTKLEAVKAYNHFILTSRRVLLLDKTPQGFKRWFDEAYSKEHMDEVVDAIFFVPIAGEIAFSRSQLGGLKFASDKLHTLVAPMRSPEARPLVDPTVPEKDAINFTAFKAFYDDLNNKDKTLLINELLLIVVLQAGNIYAQQPGVGYLAPLSPISARPKRSLSFSGTPSFFSDSSVLPQPQSEASISYANFVRIV